MGPDAVGGADDFKFVGYRRKLIEQIRNREEEERRQKKGRRPHLDLPLPMPGEQPPPGEGAEEDSERGVVIIDLSS